MDKHEVRLPVRKLVQHPFFAGVKCKSTPCGPHRINAKNDIAIVDVDDFLLRNAIDKRSIYPVGLPDVDKSYVLSDARSAGWQIFSKSLVHPVIEKGFFSEPADYSVTEIPIVVDMKVSSCRAFVGDGDGILVPANGSICLSQMTSKISMGDPIVAKVSDGDYVLIGIGQTSFLEGKEHFQETGSRFSCFIQWVADYYNLSTRSSNHVLSWSTACPTQQDISWGSTGSTVAGIPGANLINGKVRNGKPNKKFSANDSNSKKKESKKNMIVSSEKPNFLKNYPGCGKKVTTEKDDWFPWLGSLYAVDIKSKDEKFISSVALLSASSRQYPNYPTVIVSSGGIIDPYKFDLILDQVKVFGDNKVTAKDFEDMGLEVQVRFGKLKDRSKSEVILKVLSVVQHPSYAATECFIEPCGPTRYNAKNDISVIHVDSKLLTDQVSQDTIFPACLPDPSQSYLLQYVTKTGQNVKAFKQPAVKKGLFKSAESYTWSKLPSVKHLDVESCEIVTGRAIGGFYTIANGSLCLNAQANQVSGGDLVMAPDSAGKLALIGIGQHSAKEYIRSKQETATRLSCYLKWVAHQYGMKGKSSKFEVGPSLGLSI
eukprot:GFUD01047471.1.p1 GENE.GFUD01047471.1~~GFUD01047471.1.p1  ORF type:complete len:627 (+),score=145.91 GFUD01047471.1:89-1882(+)